MKLNDITISKAIITRYTTKLLDEYSEFHGSWK